MEAEHEETTKVAKIISKKKAIEIKLEEPVEWGSETIDKIILKPPRGKHIKHLSTSPNMNELIKLASKISGVSTNVFDEMGSGDIMKIVEAVGELL